MNVESATRPDFKSQQGGFTLLELLIVVSILSAIAYVALDVLKEDTAQLRFEQTDTRLKSIRQAVLGRPDRMLGTGTEISGYVADTGQLPSRLRDLLEDPCQNTTAGACGRLSSGAMRFGWRGPYISSPSFGGDMSFRDGWGNISSDATQDNDNFGWGYSFCREEDSTLISCTDGAATPDDSDLKLEIISAGRDALQNGLGAGYDAEVKSQYFLADYAHDALNLDIQLTNRSGAAITEDLCLQIYVPRLNDNATPNDRTDDFYELATIETYESDRSVPTEVQITNLADGDSITVNFDLTGDQIPWGVRGFQIFEKNVSDECEVGGSITTQLQIFRLIPRTVPPQLSVILE